eukprot:SAG11_NODE_562_length_8523_cov_38.875356_4_plen_121_part_00
MIESMESAVNLSVTLRRLAAVSQIMLAIRLIKSCRKHPRLSFITDTLIRSTIQLKPFMFIFTILCFVWATAGQILFGAAVQAFQGYRVIATMFNMLLGDFDFDSMCAKLTNRAILALSPS